MRTVEHEDIVLGLIALDVYDTAWTLHASLIPFVSTPRMPRCTAIDDRGFAYIPAGGSGFGDPERWAWNQDFTPGVAAAGRALRVGADITDDWPEMLVPVPMPTRPATARLLRSDGWPSQRWIRSRDDRWIPDGAGDIARAIQPGQPTLRTGNRSAQDSAAASLCRAVLESTYGRPVSLPIIG